MRVCSVFLFCLLPFLALALDPIEIGDNKLFFQSSLDIEILVEGLQTQSAEQRYSVSSEFDSRRTEHFTHCEPLGAISGATLENYAFSVFQTNVSGKAGERESYVKVLNQYVQDLGADHRRVCVDFEISSKNRKHCTRIFGRTRCVPGGPFTTKALVQLSATSRVRQNCLAQGVSLDSGLFISGLRVEEILENSNCGSLQGRTFLGLNSISVNHLKYRVDSERRWADFVSDNNSMEEGEPHALLLKDWDKTCHDFSVIVSNPLQHQKEFNVQLFDQDGQGDLALSFLPLIKEGISSKSYEVFLEDTPYTCLTEEL